MVLRHKRTPMEAQFEAVMAPAFMALLQGRTERAECSRSLDRACPLGDGRRVY